jgi:hypothetical protein
MVTLNRTVAVAMVHGPATALDLLVTLEFDVRLARHHRLHVTRAHLLALAGDRAAAAAGHRQAARRTTGLPERRQLTIRAAELEALIVLFRCPCSPGIGRPYIGCRAFHFRLLPFTERPAPQPPPRAAPVPRTPGRAPAASPPTTAPAPTSHASGGTRLIDRVRRPKVVLALAAVLIVVIAIVVTSIVVSMSGDHGSASTGDSGSSTSR